MFDVAQNKEVKPKTVLVVDDEPLIIDMLSNFLDVIGHKGIFASNGKEAIDCYIQDWHTIDVVILDMNMPGMKGHEVFYALKAINPEVKVVLSSGYNATNAMTALVNDGAFGFVQKPYDLSALTQFIDG